MKECDFQDFLVFTAEIDVLQILYINRIYVYCKIINIRGALFFVDFVGKLIHEFKVPTKYILNNYLYSEMKNPRI